MKITTATMTQTAQQLTLADLVTVAMTIIASSTARPVMAMMALRLCTCKPFHFSRISSMAAESGHGQHSAETEHSTAHNQYLPWNTLLFWNAMFREMNLLWYHYLVLVQWLKLIAR